jgi:hypothetical protein
MDLVKELVFFDTSVGGRDGALARSAEAQGCRVSDYLEEGVTIFVSNEKEKRRAPVIAPSCKTITSKRSKMMVSGSQENSKTTEEVSCCALLLGRIAPIRDLRHSRLHGRFVLGLWTKMDSCAWSGTLRHVAAMLRLRFRKRPIVTPQ